MSGEFDRPEPGDYDAQFEAYKAVFNEVCSEAGLSIDAILDDEETLEHVTEQVRERLVESGDDLDADSLMLLELIESLEEEGSDDGLAGDREPRVTPPAPTIGSIALSFE